jgi:hypothetical protein
VRPIAAFDTNILFPVRTWCSSAHARIPAIVSSGRSRLRRFFLPDPMESQMLPVGRVCQLGPQISCMRLALRKKSQLLSMASPFGYNAAC